MKTFVNIVASGNPGILSAGCDVSAVDDPGFFQKKTWRS